MTEKARFHGLPWTPQLKYIMAVVVHAIGYVRQVAEIIGRSYGSVNSMSYRLLRELAPTNAYKYLASTEQVSQVHQWGVHALYRYLKDKPGSLNNLCMEATRGMSEINENRVRRAAAVAARGNKLFRNDLSAGDPHEYFAYDLSENSDFTNLEKRMSTERNAGKAWTVEQRYLVEKFIMDGRSFEEIRHKMGRARDETLGALVEIANDTCLRMTAPAVTFHSNPQLLVDSLRETLLYDVGVAHSSVDHNDIKVSPSHTLGSLYDALHYQSRHVLLVDKDDRYDARLTAVIDTEDEQEGEDETPFKPLTNAQAMMLQYTLLPNLSLEALSTMPQTLTVEAADDPERYLEKLTDGMDPITKVLMKLAQADDVKLLVRMYNDTVAQAEILPEIKSTFKFELEVKDTNRLNALLKIKTALGEIEHTIKQI